MGWEGSREALGGRFASGFFCSRSETEEKPAALDMPARMPVAARPLFCSMQHTALDRLTLFVPIGGLVHEDHSLHDQLAVHNRKQAQAADM